MTITGKRSPAKPPPTSAKLLVQRAIKRGLISPPKPAGSRVPNKTRERYKVLGLTVRGRPRKNRPPGRRLTSTEYTRERRAALYAQGLTSRGMPRAKTARVNWDYEI